MCKILEVHAHHCKGSWTTHALLSVRPRVLPGAEGIWRYVCPQVAATCLA